MKEDAIKKEFFAIGIAFGILFIMMGFALYGIYHQSDVGVLNKCANSQGREIWFMWNKLKADALNISTDEIVDISYANLYNYSVRCPANFEDCFLYVVVE